MSNNTYDLVIVGGGINGCGIARDAAGRGLKVLLCEKTDFAAGTSSASTKLIHGGLRYLEHYEFALVRESLSEREVLWQMAPHIIWPLRFVLPHNAGLRPAWIIRLGLFLYDYIGGRKLLPACRSLDLRTDEAGKPLKQSIGKAFEYSDCWVDDARMVVLNAMDAAARGADIRARTECAEAVREEDQWRVKLKNGSGDAETVYAKVLLNAAGPWVADVIEKKVGGNAKASVRLVKGSHIVVPKIFDHDRCYIFQNADRRIIFAIPYQDDFTLIGTTDVELESLPDKVEIEQSEIDYLCRAVSEYFEKPVTLDDVVWTYAGIRPLYNDGDGSAQEVTRDYVLDRTGEASGPVLLNVFGGKITTYRRLAQDALAKLSDVFPNAGKPWTRGAALPGGEFNCDGFDAKVARLIADYPDLPAKLLRRLVRAYGTRARMVLGCATDIASLGQHFGDTLYEREVKYLVREEWAGSAEDVLWRRSKLGLRLSDAEVTELEQWFMRAAKNKEPLEA